MNPLAIQSDSWLGIFGSVGLLLISYVAKKYIIPFLQVGKRQKFAQYITIIADEVIDELRSKYPERTWLAHLDEAIKILSEICDISPEIAERAVKASAARK
jgi:hypothetical protein